MEKVYYLGLDNGGSVTKAALFDNLGNEVAVARKIAETLNDTPGGWVERDSEDFFKANVWCIRECVAKSGVKPEQIRAVAVTGHGNGLYLVGHDGKPAYNGIISTDTRAAELVRVWCENGTASRILPSTNQALWAGQLGPLLAWFAQNKPEVLAGTKHAFSCTDYIRFRLTGEAFGESSNMSSASIMSQKGAQYDDDVLEQLGIGEYRALLPPLCRSHDICGTVRPDTGALCGLRPGTPVAGGMVDFAAGPVACGITTPDLLSTLAGTWTINSYLCPTPIADESLFMTSLFPQDGTYQIMEGSMTSASNLEWFVQNMMTHDAVVMKQLKKSVYGVCDEIIDLIRPEDSDLIFLPFLYGTNVNADARAGFMGLGYRHSRSHMIRAIFEGVVFSCAQHVENLLRIRKSPFAGARIAGGPANSRQWTQIFADVLELPMEVSQAQEIGAMGAAIASAVAVGDFAGYAQAAEVFTKIRAVMEPDAARGEIYRRKYKIYRETLQAMDSVWYNWRQN